MSQISEATSSDICAMEAEAAPGMAARVCAAQVTTASGKCFYLAGTQDGKQWFKGKDGTDYHLKYLCAFNGCKSAGGHGSKKSAAEPAAQTAAAMGGTTAGGHGGGAAETPRPAAGNMASAAAAVVEAAGAAARAVIGSSIGASLQIDAIGPASRARGGTALFQEDFLARTNQIVGHRLCNPARMSTTARRSQLSSKRCKPEWLVRGLFAEGDGVDDGTEDTRWVEQEELFESIGSDDADQMSNLTEMLLTRMAEYFTRMGKTMAAEAMTRAAQVIALHH